MTRFRIYSTVLIFSLIMTSCAMPGLPMNRNAFNTAVAQTVAAGLTQDYVSPTFTLTPSITPTATITPLPPTVTNTPPDSPTPTISLTPSISPTPDIPRPDLNVSVNTNCRSGAGSEFPVRGSLVVGKTVQIYGVDPTGAYWYITNPNSEGDFCWLAATYATPQSSTSFVPVLTPPATYTPSATATPTADFKISYVKLGGCGDWVVEMNVENIGQVPFKSAYYKLKENYSGANPTKFTDGFVHLEKCDGKTTVDTLDPGMSTVISGPALNVNPTGRKITFTAVLCTELKGNGTCISKTIVFRVVKEQS